MLNGYLEDYCATAKEGDETNLHLLCCMLMELMWQPSLVHPSSSPSNETTREEQVPLVIASGEGEGSADWHADLAYRQATPCQEFTAGRATVPRQVSYREREHCRAPLPI
jgi:hypothetical protein